MATSIDTAAKADSGTNGPIVATPQKITPFLWFDGQVEEAVNLYTSVFKNSEIVNISRLPAKAPGWDGQVTMATFRLNGVEFMALDAGPKFKFTEAVSFFVHCETQEEVDHLWNSLTADGGQESQCGWLKDKFGLSWQIIPNALGQLMGSPDREKAGKAMNAMLGMKKIDIAELKRAYDS